MPNIISAIKPFYKAALWKALLAAILFLLLYQFQSQNIVRENVDDIAFDIIDKLWLSEKPQNTGADLVTVLAFDNAYMKSHNLFDDDINLANYGYTFPREHIAKAIQRIDQRLEKLAEITNKAPCPKALFIDFDLSYATNENGELSEGDKALLNTLAKPDRCYPILLSMSQRHNIVKDSSNPVILSLINKKIFFVSPFFHYGSDDVTRRYEPIKPIDGINYPAAPLALWQIIKHGKIDTAQLQAINDPVNRQRNSQHNSDVKPDVNSTMIWIKHYQKPKDGIQRSHWQQLQKRSLGLEKPIPHDRIDKQVLLLGGTDQEDPNYRAGSGDYHKVLNFISDESMAGVDIHANTLMTFLYLSQGKQNLPLMNQISWFTGTLLVFVSFFIVSLLTQLLLSRFNINSEQLGLTLSVLANLGVLFILSIWLMHSEKHLWFNWFTVFILFESIEGILFIKGYAPLFIKLPVLRVVRYIQGKIINGLKIISSRMINRKTHHD